MLPDRRTRGAIGGGVLLLALAQTVRFWFGWLSELERWKAMIGPITAEGWRQLLYLAAVILLSPAVWSALEPSIKSRVDKWRENRRVRQLAEQIIPAIDGPFLADLVQLHRDGPRERRDEPYQLTVTRWRRYGDARSLDVVAIHPEAAKFLEKYLEENPDLVLDIEESP